MPASDDRGGMGEAYEPVLVQAFISEAAVEGLDIGVLVRFAGFDLFELDTVVIGLFQHGLADELGACVFRRT